ncbi:hypothetical protein ACIRQP_02675 [Streptomyces sp. NPDC102274]|uniref:hypothetical protein n=1 Tax=Streptomyces sp. NPDC102274 TaxID=3366151 RepID=UPI003816D92A
MTGPTLSDRPDTEYLAGSRPEAPLPFCHHTGEPVPDFGGSALPGGAVLIRRSRSRTHIATVPFFGPTMPVISRRDEPDIIDLGRLRYVVEQTVAQLHQFKRLTIRWDDALVSLACELISWRRLCRRAS